MNKVDHTPENNEELDFDFLEWAIELGKEKITILIVTIIFFVASIIYSLLATPTYSAKTIISLNNSQQSHISSAISTISSLSGVTLGNNVKSQDDFYINLLQSESLQNAVIKKLELQKLFKTEKLIDTRQRLKAVYRTTADKKVGVIIIEVESIDPEFSAKLANALVEELRILLGKHALEAAKKRLEFYERAITKTQIDLVEAKSKFTGANEKSGILSNSSLTENIYSQINNKELQINALSHFSTALNPDLRRLEVELNALRTHLFKSNEKPETSIEKDSSQQTAVNAYREIKSLELILSALTSQYKSALTESFSSEPYVQQLEVATTPEQRSQPQRTKIVFNYSILGLIIGLATAIIKVQIGKITKDPILNQKAINLKKSWLGLNGENAQ